MPDLSPPVIHFGGPDKEPRALRNLLKQRVEAVPTGGEIVWSTYYFRDRDLAAALIAAARRGVRVTLHVEGTPRLFTANDPVIQMLRFHGLGGGLHVHEAQCRVLRALHPHLHSKIYYFSHPTPRSLVGSFNPSGDDPEDISIIAEIGDQDRGHNVLFEFFEPELVAALKRHVLAMKGFAIRFRPAQNALVRCLQSTIWFFPRLLPNSIDAEFANLAHDDSVFGAVSHLKSGRLSAQLIKAARAGTKVELITHDTTRRTPTATFSALKDAGINIVRYRHPEGLPMHAKFLLIGKKDKRKALFGSFNFNPRSRYFNREIVISSEDETIISSLESRFHEISKEIREMRHFS